MTELLSFCYRIRIPSLLILPSNDLLKVAFRHFLNSYSITQYYFQLDLMRVCTYSPRIFFFIQSNRHLSHKLVSFPYIDTFRYVEWTKQTSMKSKLLSVMMLAGCCIDAHLNKKNKRRAPRAPSKFNVKLNKVTIEQKK